MVNLTLRRWLQPTFSINKRSQKTGDRCFKEKLVDPFSTPEQDLSQPTPSLTYLDDYINQYF